jgi:hypothetical protein
MIRHKSFSSWRIFPFYRHHLAAPRTRFSSLNRRWVFNNCLNGGFNPLSSPCARVARARNSIFSPPKGLKLVTSFIHSCLALCWIVSRYLLPHCRARSWHRSVQSRSLSHSLSRTQPFGQAPEARCDDEQRKLLNTWVLWIKLVYRCDSYRTLWERAGGWWWWKSKLL